MKERHKKTIKRLESLALGAIVGGVLSFIAFSSLPANSPKIDSYLGNRYGSAYEKNLKAYLGAKLEHNGIRDIVLPSDKRSRDFDNDGIEDKYIICNDGTYIIYNSSDNSWKDIGLGI